MRVVCLRCWEPPKHRPSTIKTDLAPITAKADSGWHLRSSSHPTATAKKPPAVNMSFFFSSRWIQTSLGSRTYVRKIIRARNFSQLFFSEPLDRLQNDLNSLFTGNFVIGSTRYLYKNICIRFSTQMAHFSPS